jgi:hypothetical protein
MGMRSLRWWKQSGKEEIIVVKKPGAPLRAFLFAGYSGKFFIPHKAFFFK